jgi:hypothetical protein
MVATHPSVTLFNLTSGVFPIKSNTFSAMLSYNDVVGIRGDVVRGIKAVAAPRKSDRAAKSLMVGCFVPCLSTCHRERSHDLGQNAENMS